MLTKFKAAVLAGTVATSLFPGVAAFGATQAVQCGEPYTVVRGDSLSRLSLRAYGSLVYQPIYTANVKEIGMNPDLIFIDQVFDIPCMSAGAVEASESASLAQTGESGTDAAVKDQLVFTFNKASAPPFIINSGIIDGYLADITEATQGRVTFVDPEVVNRDHAAQFQLVTSGAVDGAYVLNGTIADTHPLLQLSMTPMLGGSAEQTAISLWRLHAEFLSETNYFSQAQLLGFVASPAAHIWREAETPVRPGEGIAQKNQYALPYFNGLDTRGPAAMRAELSQFRASYAPTSNEPPAFFMAHGAAVATGLWDTTASVAVTEVDNGLYTPSFSVILSNEAWAQISPADQDAIREISGEALSRRSAAWDGFDNAFRSQMLDSGLQGEKADKALLEDLWLSSLPALNRWRTAAESLGIPSDAALNSYLANLRSLQDRLIYRSSETYVDQNPFVRGGN